MDWLLVLYVVFGSLGIVSAFILFRKDSKKIAVLQLTLSTITLILAIVQGFFITGAIWLLITILAAVRLLIKIKKEKVENEKKVDQIIAEL